MSERISDDLLDRPAIGRLCDQIGAENVRELGQMFLDDLRPVLAVLDTAAAAEDRATLSATAHRVKSSALALGAAALGSLFHELEQQGPSEDWQTLIGLVERSHTVAAQTASALTADLAGR